MDERNLRCTTYYTYLVLETMQALGSELRRDETTLVLVSGKRSITKEWRFFVYENEVVTGSLYLIGEEQVNETIKGGDLDEFGFQGGDPMFQWTGDFFKLLSGHRSHLGMSSPV
jgi:hypothetical protein